VALPPWSTAVIAAVIDTFVSKTSSGRDGFDAANTGSAVYLIRVWKTSLFETE
jgi:hypothetical protein